MVVLSARQRSGIIPVSLQSTLPFPLVAELRERIEVALDRSTRFDGGCPDRLREAIRYSLLAPGKRLRPVLVLLAAEACGGTVEEAMPAACAVEMVHAYSLVHDDLPAMDDDDLRRGRPTCHKVFGEGMAILAGDALLALAFEVLAKGVRPPAVAGACCAALAEAAGACHLVGGQADDIDGSPAPNLETLEFVHRRKTGAMITVSLALGAMTAGADPRKTEALLDYGRRLGLAFQITDDLLDVQGDEHTVGKRVRKDARAGRATFPGLLGAEASLDRARQLVAEACAALAPLGPRADGLRALARYVLERNH
jgi:geranylgeranyl diphosphate synthase type II